MENRCYTIDFVHRNWHSTNTIKDLTNILPILQEFLEDIIDILKTQCPFRHSSYFLAEQSVQSVEKQD